MTNCLAKKDLEACNLAKLDDERKAQVLAIKDSISFDYNSISEYAGSASKSLTDFSSDLLRSVKLKDAPEVEDLLIEQGDSVLIEKIDSSINSTIPLWESQMVIAIQLMRQKGALAIERAVTATTNNLLEKNSQLLKSSTIEVAKSLEEGIVDINVIKKNNQTLIETLQEVVKIREDGKTSRLKATQEIGLLQAKLNEQLLLTSGV